MNNYDLFAALGDIDEELLASCETARPRKPAYARFAGLAACLCLAVGGAFLALRPGAQPPDTLLDYRPAPTAAASPTAPPETTEPVAYPHISFNDLSGSPLGCPAPDSAYFLLFGEALNEAETAEVSPLLPDGDIHVEGSAQYLGTSTLDHVSLEVTPDGGRTVRVSMSAFDSAYVLFTGYQPEYTATYFDDLGFMAYSDVGDSGYGQLWTEFRLGDVACRASVDVIPGELDAAREALELVMAGYARRESAPDLGIFSMRETHIWQDDELELAEARLDPDFGACLPWESPAGFTPDKARRHVDDESDYLHAFWQGYYSDLRWHIRYYKDTDAQRLTPVEDKENYDLSLYPIPRADSVPEDKRQIVDNPIFDLGELTSEAVWARAYKVHDAGDTDGWRVRFSVKAGDVVIEISSKGVNPDWLYAQLDAMR